MAIQRELVGGVVEDGSREAAKRVLECSVPLVTGAASATEAKQVLSTIRPDVLVRYI